MCLFLEGRKGGTEEAVGECKARGGTSTLTTRVPVIQWAGSGRCTVLCLKPTKRMSTMLACAFAGETPLQATCQGGIYVPAFGWRTSMLCSFILLLEVLSQVLSRHLQR